MAASSEDETAEEEQDWCCWYNVVIVRTRCNPNQIIGRITIVDSQELEELIRNYEHTLEMGSSNGKKHHCWF